MDFARLTAPPSGVPPRGAKQTAQRLRSTAERQTSLPDASDPVHAVLASIAQGAPCTTEAALQNAFTITTLESRRNPRLQRECGAHSVLRCRFIAAVPGHTLDLEHLRAQARGPGARMDFHLWWVRPLGVRGAGSAGEFSLALAHRAVYDAMLLVSRPPPFEPHLCRVRRCKHSTKAIHSSS